MRSTSDSSSCGGSCGSQPGCGFRIRISIPPEVKSVAGRVRFCLHAELQGGFFELQESCAGRLYSVPQLVWVEVRDHASHSSKVIAVGVGDDDGVQARDATRPEIRRHHLFTNIEIRVRVA